MMNFCCGYFGASALRMSCIWVVPVMTMPHLPATDSRFDFHWAGLLASDWMTCVLYPEDSRLFMPRAASSKKPWSPRGPLTTFATDGLLAPALPPLAVELLVPPDDDDPQPASVTDTAARTAIPRERFFMGLPFGGGGAGEQLTDLGARRHRRRGAEGLGGERGGGYRPVHGLGQALAPGECVGERADEAVARPGGVDDRDRRIPGHGEPAVLEDNGATSAEGDDDGTAQARLGDPPGEGLRVVPDLHPRHPGELPLVHDEDVDAPEQVGVERPGGSRVEQEPAGGVPGGDADRLERDLELGHGDSCAAQGAAGRGDVLGAQFRVGTADDDDGVLRLVVHQHE